MSALEFGADGFPAFFAAAPVVRAYRFEPPTRPNGVEPLELDDYLLTHSGIHRVREPTEAPLSPRRRRSGPWRATRPAPKPTAPRPAGPPARP